MIVELHIFLLSKQHTSFHIRWQATCMQKSHYLKQPRQQFYKYNPSGAKKDTYKNCSQLFSEPHRRSASCRLPHPLAQLSLHCQQSMAKQNKNSQRIKTKIIRTSHHSHYFCSNKIKFKGGKSQNSNNICIPLAS